MSRKNYIVKIDGKTIATKFNSSGVFNYATVGRYDFEKYESDAYATCTENDLADDGLLHLVGEDPSEERKKLLVMFNAANNKKEKLRLLRLLKIKKFEDDTNNGKYELRVFSWHKSITKAKNSAKFYENPESWTKDIQVVPVYFQDEETNKKTCEKFEILRQVCGLTQKEASAFLGHPLDTIKNWSTNRRTPSDDVLVKMATLAARIDGEAKNQKWPVAIAATDEQARQLGWPCLGAHRAFAGRVLARSIVAPIERKKKATAKKVYYQNISETKEAVEIMNSIPSHKNEAGLRVFKLGEIFKGD